MKLLFCLPTTALSGGVKIVFEIATRLARVFPDFQLEVFEDRHHFDPPHRVEPDRLAGSLRAHWARGS